MADRDELLAGFHHTISEQLNARLSESPKFFGLLIIISTGYGYVLSRPELSEQKELFVLASLLSFVAVLWASWYLAALGYAFRFLQNSQHCLEHALGWNPRFVPRAENGRATGNPPWPPDTIAKIFWLLPGIYHAHAAGLVVLLATICAAFGWHFWNCWTHCLVMLISTVAFLLGFGFILFMNRHYLYRFRNKRRDP